MVDGFLSKEAQGVKNERQKMADLDFLKKYGGPFAN